MLDEQAQHVKSYSTNQWLYKYAKNFNMLALSTKVCQSYVLKPTSSSKFIASMPFNFSTSGEEMRA